ncbi:MAG: PKD domain-containing protein, partial [Vicingaceae bacterium]
MKHIFTLFLVFFVAHNAAGQTASVTNGCAPLTVAFTSPSSSTYFWNFNDGATSSLPNPSNTFLTPNTYVVEFRTTQNGPIVGTVTINVEAKPVPIFTSDASSGCAPISIQFTDATVLPPSVQVNSYSWVFGDGGSAIGSSTTHVFNASGNFFVSLELNTSSPSCNVTKQYDNFISASTPPTVGFTTNPDPPVACISPLNISFNNTSSSNFGNLTYKWDLGNTQTSTATNPPNQTYTIDQNYVVALVATDTNNCANSTSKTISVGSPTVDLVFPDTICLNL